jgi:hypothetical protein
MLQFVDPSPDAQRLRTIERIHCGTENGWVRPKREYFCTIVDIIF